MGAWPVVSAGMTNRLVLVAFGLAIGLVAGWWFAQDPERTRAARVEEPHESHSAIAQLKRENAELRERVAALERPPRELLAERVGQAHTAHIVIPLGRAPLPDHLRGIELPTKPTKQQAGDYA